VWFRAPEGSGGHRREEAVAGGRRQRRRVGRGRGGAIVRLEHEKNCKLLEKEKGPSCQSIRLDVVCPNQLFFELI
jgi:hypothetical protein